LVTAGTESVKHYLIRGRIEGKKRLEVRFAGSKKETPLV
jgi:hypothetical protein